VPNRRQEGPSGTPGMQMAPTATAPTSFQRSFLRPAGTYAAHMIGTSVRWSCIAQTRYTTPVTDVATLATSDVAARVHAASRRGEVTRRIRSRAAHRPAGDQQRCGRSSSITHPVPAARAIPLT
jgi:hypothetical protein